MDPRMADRRRTVLETGARRGVRRAMVVLIVASLVAAGAWVIQSPWLSVSEVAVAGSDRAEILEAIASAGLETGTPLLLVRTDAVRESLESLAWVRSAEVRRVFPDRVEVMIDERHPVALMWSSDSYGVLDGEGVVLEYVSDATAGVPVLRLAERRLDPAEAYVGDTVRGALEFAVALDGALPGIEVRAEGEELWAAFEGHEIRLGRPVDMAAKAAALVAVVTDGIPAGSSVNLIAPTRPAVTPLQPSS